jgi:hypothetical protein
LSWAHNQAAREVDVGDAISVRQTFDRRCDSAGPTTATTVRHDEPVVSVE